MQVVPIVIPEDIRAKIQDAADRGESPEDLSRLMASLGLEKIIAIKLLSDTTKMGLARAKETIHYSPAWAFRRASDEEFHNRLFVSAQKAGLLKSDPEDGASQQNSVASVSAGSSD